jgi:tetratricopeptide (TPR) repeat protein
MAAEPRPRLARVAPALVAALVLAFALHRLDAFDVWFHLAAARLMLETGAWPAVNTLAFTAPDHPWVDIQWLFQLLLYGAFALGGAAGCTLLAAGLALATAGVLWGSARRELPPAAAACLLAVAVVVASPRLVPRPELVSFLLLAVYLRLLDAHPRCGRALWLLVPLQVLWTNAHGLFPIGVALVGCYWAAATLAFLPLPAGWRAASGLDGRAWRRLGLVLLAVAAACLLNPWGLDGARFPLELLTKATGGSIFSLRIGELRPPLEGGGHLLGWLWAALVAATALSFAANVRRWHLGRLLAVAGLAALSARATRNTALFAWAAVPALAANAGALLAARDPRFSGRLRRGAASTVAVALALLVAVVATNHLSRLLDGRRELGLGVATARFPTEAVSFAEEVGIGGRPFNCLAVGGYLAWRRFPAERVFIDGRLEAYPESVFRAYFRALDDPKVWGRIVELYRPDYVLLAHAWPNRRPLAAYLAAGHGWRIVYYDAYASLFLPEDRLELVDRAERAFAAIRVRRGEAPPPAPIGTLERWVRYPVAAVWRERSYGDFLRGMGWHREAAAAYERALALDPGLSEVRLLLGLAYWRDGRREAAVREWRETLRRDPDFEPAARALRDAAAGPPAAPAR